MSREIKRRRGTTVEHQNFIGAEGEITVDTTKKTVVVHDGQTLGGFPLAKESDVHNLSTQINDNTNEIANLQDNLNTLETEVNNNATELQNVQDDFDRHKAESVNDGVHGMGTIASQEYEEGTWTPTLHFGGNNDGMTYASQLGRYVRTGNLVYFEMQIVLTSKGSSVGNATIAGLPFSAVGSPTRSFIISDVLNFPIRDNEYIMARLSAGSVMSLIYTSDMSNAILTITEADFSDGTRIILSGHYRI